MNIPQTPRRGSIEPVDAKPRQTREPRPLPVPRLPSSERRVKPRLSKSSLDPVMEIDHRLPGDAQNQHPVNVTRATKRQSLPDLSKRRGDYFEETFAARDMDNPGDRVRSESIVLAEVKTNVIVNDEYTFVSELSEHLALRYNRPLSSIVVTLQQGACLLFSGSCDPAYIMTVEALACYAQTATNKRNVALLQRHIEQALGIPAARGLLRFVPVPEECAGWKGKTVAGEVAEAIVQAQTVFERRNSIKTPKRKSSKAHRNRTATAETAETGQDVSQERFTENPVSCKELAQDGDKDKSKIMKRRKSFMQALFPRSSLSRATGHGETGARE
ncbi:hypothetical protein FZEAL_825 [Fusarium zealandicum]|uniref:L-dopachrome isomerase n=1 Tax=Fusarium zealandicum TaxID=1053134 RepID=A0A8H4UUS2_9HYPO|nr:hypothetical protein FZEAL_825 [Fusarium zealandicum]